VRTLAGFSGASVRETLGRFLEDPNATVVTEAALGLARQTEGVALPYLLAILKRPGDPARQKALEAVEEITSVSLAVSGYDAAAEQYESWYALHREGGDRAWFRDALARRGYEGAALSGYVHGDADLKAVPVLLRAIRDDDPIVRRNANVALERITGKRLGTVLRGTPREEALAVADRWSLWWSRNNPTAPRR
jgi:HEAT repeat protein